jgi:hypothetical protein
MWSSQTNIAASPSDVLYALTDADAIRRWSPVDFDLEDFDCCTLREGCSTRVVGRVAGVGVAFDVEVTAADTERLSLTASGPVTFDVDYAIEPADDGAAVEARVDVRGGRGLAGGIVARTARTLLSAGALEGALRRIASEAETTSADCALAA